MFDNIQQTKINYEIIDNLLLKKVFCDIKKVIGIKESIFMNPIIKWAGGKEKELPYIKENLPSEIDRYIEPFVGGRSGLF